MTAFFDLDEVGLAGDFGPDAGDFPGRHLDQRLGRRFVHDFHVPLGDLLAEGSPQRGVAHAVTPSAHAGGAWEFGVFGLEDAERIGLDAQRLEPIVQLQHLFGKGLDALLFGEAAAQGADVLHGLLEVRGRPPHIAGDLAVAALIFLLHLFQNDDFGAGIRRGDGSRKSGMSRSHDNYINFLVPLGRSAVCLRYGGSQSAGYASGSDGRSGDHGALEKLPTIYRDIVDGHDSILFGLFLIRQNMNSVRNFAGNHRTRVSGMAFFAGRQIILVMACIAPLHAHFGHVDRSLGRQGRKRMRRVAVAAIRNIFLPVSNRAEHSDED